MSNLLEFLDIRQRNLAVDAITLAVEASFVQDGARQTQNEIKRRFNLSLGLIGAMRHDLGWSWQRIGDTLPSALRSKLDTGDWTPSTRSSWLTDASSGLILPPGLK